jgi:hypothetical protein
LWIRRISPFAIGAWFGPQQILEVLYLKELYYPSGGKLEAITLDIAPYFTLGNLMIGTWPFFVSDNGDGMTGCQSERDVDEASFHSVSYFFGSL